MQAITWRRETIQVRGSMIHHPNHSRVIGVYEPITVLLKHDDEEERRLRPLFPSGQSVLVASRSSGSRNINPLTFSFLPLADIDYSDSNDHGSEASKEEAPKLVIPPSSSSSSSVAPHVPSPVSSTSSPPSSFFKVLWSFTRPHTFIGTALCIPALHLYAAPSRE